MRMRSNDRPAWRGVGHPVKAVLDIARRAERRRRGAADTIAAMEKTGVTLQLQFANGSELWRLCNGMFVPPDDAAS